MSVAGKARETHASLFVICEEHHVAFHIIVNGAYATDICGIVLDVSATDLYIVNHNIIVGTLLRIIPKILVFHPAVHSSYWISALV